MHSCGAALIASKANAEQGERWLRPAATGTGLATLAFSERGTGAHFYAPELTAEKRNGGFAVSGRKSFVTNGGHAAVYPILVNASGKPGLDVLLVSPDLAGVDFEGQWDGIGMAGNSSIAMQLADVELSPDRLLGQEGDGQELVFNVVAPHFLVGLAAVNVGIAQAAVDATVEHVKSRRYVTGQTLAEIPNTQRSLAEMNIATESARRLTTTAARAGDDGDPSALVLIIEAKIAATEAAMAVTVGAMQVTGAQGYTRRLPIERFWRDAHAGSVMAPTNDVLKEWVGKLLTGLPLF
jgi:alkylation response protein AidB-like acyl-CoA dehydrogenase